MLKFLPCPTPCLSRRSRREKTNKKHSLFRLCPVTTYMEVVLANPMITLDISETDVAQNDRSVTV